MDNNNILELHSVDVGYKKRVVLRDLCLNITPGKIVTLIGPNGAGKSTVLKTIVKEIEAMSGEIMLSGKNMSVLSGNDIAKTISMVMTTRPNPELMTCREVVSTGRYPYVGRLGILSKEDWDIVDQAIVDLGADDIADEYFTQISDGQKQRIMLARALCQEPKVLILDEPTTYLDIRYKLELLEVIQRVARIRNIAIVMSIHELDLAIKISDIICAVDGNTVVYTGTPDNVIKAGILQDLYHISALNYQPLTGSLYLSKASDEPKVFVIGGGGSGILTYYRLQRESVSFAAGIIAMEDMEYEVASALGTKVVHPDKFHPITEKELLEAQHLLDKCEFYICTLDEFGPLNEMNKKLLDYAKACGMKEYGN